MTFSQYDLIGYLNLWPNLFIETESYLKDEINYLVVIWFQFFNYRLHYYHSNFTVYHMFKCLNSEQNLLCILTSK